MKKIIILFICILTLLPVYSQTVYTVETNKGTQEVVIPDDMTETDVLLYLAKSYYNLYYDNEALKEEVVELTSKTESYIEENKNLRDKYDTTLSRYGSLTSYYEKLIKPDFIRGSFGADITFNEIFKVNIVSLTLGAVIYEKTNIYARVGLDLQTSHLTYGLGVSIIF